MPVSTEEAVSEYTRYFRAIIENAWNDNTAHAYYRPLPTELARQALLAPAGRSRRR